MAAKQILIEPKDLGFGMNPVFPEVKPGYEVLEFRVNWSGNAGCFREVVIKNFRLPDGKEAQISPAELRFPLGVETAPPVRFNFTVKDPTPCKFDVELHRVHPDEVILIDPGIILQPGP